MLDKKKYPVERNKKWPDKDGQSASYILGKVLA